MAIQVVSFIFARYFTKGRQFLCVCFKNVNAIIILTIKLLHIIIQENCVFKFCNNVRNIRYVSLAYFSQPIQNQSNEIIKSSLNTKLSNIMLTINTTMSGLPLMPRIFFYEGIAQYSQLIYNNKLTTFKS